MAINKVIYGTSTLIDLTADTVATDTLGKDISAHDKSGAEIIGTLESGGGTQSETWVWNEDLNVLFDSFSVSISFISNGISYNALNGVGSASRVGMKYNSTSVWTVNFGWADSVYRKVTFLEPPTGELLEYLQTNATKQPSNIALQPSKSVEITANGTTAVTPDVPYDGIQSVEVTTRVLITD